MAFLVDTNVLLRLAAPRDAHHVAARSATRQLKGRSQELFTSSQNLIEAWNVATRPQDKNGLGHTPEEAGRLVGALERGFPRLGDTVDFYDRRRELVVRFKVSGVQVHDAKLAAIMLAHKITEILTFNVRDFQRYARVGIHAVDPRDV